MYQKLGVLPEQNGFYDWMTAVDYLAFFAALYKRQPSRDALDEQLARVGLAPRPGQSIGTFSRGMRQRLGLARALVADPDLLILDEPTNGLDPRGRREVHDLLLDLSHNRGVGVLLCTHLLDDVDRLSTRIGVIVAGRTVAEGAITDLMRMHGPLARFRLRLDQVSSRSIAPGTSSTSILQPTHQRCGECFCLWDGLSRRLSGKAGGLKNSIST